MPVWLMPASDDRRRPRSDASLGVLSAIAILLAGGFSMSAGSGIARAATGPVASPASAPVQAEPINCGPTDSAGELPIGDQSIDGLVTNGVGDPVPDLQVRIATSAGGLGTTTTNAEGRYLLGSLGDGSYIVSFYDWTALYESGFYAGGPTVLTPDAATPVALTGTGATGIDATLADETLHTVSGFVTDNNTDAVDGALVRASGLYFPLVGCFSTESGNYAIPDVRTGVYEISLQASGEPDGFYDASTPTTHFSIHVSDATPVTVAADVSGINIQFPPTYTLTGVVLDASDNPVGDISVAACPVGGGGCGYATSSGVDGSFEIPTLVEASYTVYEQDVSGSNLYLSGYYAGDGAFSEASGDAVAVAVPGGSIQLLAVAAPQVQGSILDAAGINGLGDLTVSLCDLDEFNCFGATTAADGTYAVGIPLTGTYLARVIDNSQTRPSGGYIATSGPFVTTDHDAALQITVGGSNVPVADAWLPDGGRIQVSVTSGGSPLPDELVQFCRTDVICPDGLNTDSSGIALSPAMFSGTYYVQGTADYQSFYWYRSGLIASLDFGTATAVFVADDGSTTSIDMEVPAAGTATDAGDTVAPVEVALDDGTGNTPVTLTFPDVTVSGTTSLTVSDTGTPVPDGFQLGLPATYFDITTTAEFTGDIEVCFSYAGISFENEATLQLYHYDSTIPGWDPITSSLNTETQVICGLTSSLSPFVIVERTFEFGGFFGPKAPPQFNDAKAGDTIGVQFSMGGDAGLAIFAADTPTFTQIDCTTGAVIGTAEAATGTLKYSKRTERYTYSWTTSKTWKGTCQELTLTFQDGSTAAVWYRFGTVTGGGHPHGH
jgi:hypothetical protein